MKYIQIGYTKELFYLSNELYLLKLLIVVDTIVFINSSLIDNNKGSNYIEYNPDLTIYSQKNCFWDTTEIEYKIDIQSQHFDFNSLFNDSSDRFEFGKSCLKVSYERYKEIKYRQILTYIVILGKRNWNQKMAIKYKLPKPGNILTRKVIICHYNEENFKQSIMNLTNCTLVSEVEINSFPPFYKHKYRCVCIDKEKGYVFGVSFGDAKLLNKSRMSFKQIEIEFWSKIIDKSSNKCQLYDDDFNKSFQELINLCRKKLDYENIPYHLPGGTKYEWLKTCKKQL